MAGRYVEREIVNHSMLLHPHIIQFKEASSHPFSATPNATTIALCRCRRHTADVCTCQQWGNQDKA